MPNTDLIDNVHMYSPAVQHNHRWCPKCRGEEATGKISMRNSPLRNVARKLPSRLFHPPPLEAWFYASALIIILNETGQCSCTLLQSLTHSITIIITRCLCFSFTSLQISQSLFLLSFPFFSLIQRSRQFEFNVPPWKDTHKHWPQVYIWSIEIQVVDYNVLLWKTI